jgi:chromate transporter
MADLSLYWTLFWEFFKTGLFALGGGLATIPFLNEMSTRYGWFTKSDLLNMIAVSESTPGPIGVNMATYVGFHTTGNNFFGGVMTTLALVLPSVIVVCLVAKALEVFKDNKYVNYAFSGLRPAVCALIASAGISVFVSVLFGDTVSLATLSWINLALVVVFWIASQFMKKLHPIVLILICAAVGIVLQL